MPVTIPATGSGTATPIVSTDNVTADSTQVQNIQWVTVSGGVLARISNANPVPISDAGGSLTVDAPVGTPAFVRLSDGSAAITTLPVSGPVTDTQLRATAVPVSGTVSTTPPANASTNLAQIAGTTVLTGHGVATGALRVELPTDGTGIVGLAAGANAIGSVTANLGTIAGVSTAAKQPALGTAGSPSADVLTVQGNASGTPIPVSGSFSASGTTDLTASGSLVGTGSVSITTLNGMSVAELNISGTYSASLLAEGTVDGTNWFGIPTPVVSSLGVGTPNPNSNSINANGTYQVNVAGYSGVRVRCSAFVSGTIVIALRASAAAGLNQNLGSIAGNPIDTSSGSLSTGTMRVVLATDQPVLANNLGVNVAKINSVTPLMGNGVTGTGAQRVSIASDSTGQTKLVDSGGTNQATVKAASTAAVAADPALVVALSPNNSPVGHGTAATALRVELPTDGTGVVGLAAGAAAIGSVTVTGTPSVDTELPAAAAMADGLSTTPTIPQVGAFNLVHDPNGATVNRQKSVYNTMNMAGTGIAAAGMVGQFDDVSPTAISENQFGPSRISANRNLYTTLRDAAGNERGVNVSAGNALIVDNSAVTQTTELSTGLTTFFNSALSNTKTAVKAGAGKVYGYMIHNPSAATVFIQVWNVAIASITVGTTAPTYVIAIPTGASANVLGERGVTHSTEINVAATTTATGSTAPATAAVATIWYI